MEIPRFSDEALVTLTSTESSPDLLFPVRQFLLTKANNTVRIGRTSKRDSAFQAGKNNGWFDSAVMSRDHAKIHLGEDSQSFYIQDTGSLHGTFLNGHRIEKNRPRTLLNNDNVTFGVVVDRAGQSFPPCSLKLAAVFGKERRPKTNPTVYRVPDDSDVEETEGDDLQVESALKILNARTTRVVPLDQSFDLTIPGTSSNQTTAYIDLTMTTTPNAGPGPVEPSAPDNDELLESTHSSPTTSPPYSLHSAHHPPTSPSMTSDVHDEGQEEQSPLLAASCVFDQLDQAEKDLEVLEDLEEAAGAVPCSDDELVPANSDYDDQDFDEYDEFEPNEMDELEESNEASNGGEILDISDNQSWHMENLMNESPPTDQLESYIRLDSTAQDQPSGELLLMSNDTSQLPPLAQDLSIKPSQIQLPSIRVLTGSPPQPPPPVSDSLENLISKTGKSDFFYAREENKTKAQQPLAATLISRRSTSVPRASAAAQDEDASEVRNVLSATEKPTTQPLPIAIVGAEEDTTMDEQQVGETSSTRPMTPEIISDASLRKKRNAEEISESTSEEATVMAGNSMPTPSHQPDLISPLTPPQSPPLDKSVKSSLNHEQPRAAKRYRRVAEFAGMAALGGVAVMSALIATAPAL